jgi:hypothetical protein
MLKERWLWLSMLQVIGEANTLQSIDIKYHVVREHVEVFGENYS